MTKSAKLLQCSVGPRGQCVRVGSPRSTGAIATPLPINGWTPIEQIPSAVLEVYATGVNLEFTLNPTDRVFGLGGSIGPVDRRGGTFRLFARDESLHTPDAGSIYGSHPFIVIAGLHPHALFIDSPGEINFDVGFSDSHRVKVRIASRDFDLFLWRNGQPEEYVRDFLSLVGTPYVPPRWSFGYQQCRYSYETEGQVKEVFESFNQNQIPLDAIYLDIDYMQDYKVFSFDENRFPALSEMVSMLQAEGVETIAIVDPGICDEPGFAPRESGLSQDVFCVDEAGKPFRAGVWPGYTLLPDFMRASTRKWWASQYESLFALGLRHAWNDMNEPAIFYAEDGLRRLQACVDEISVEDGLGTKPFHHYLAITSFLKDERYYHSFFHRTDQGDLVPHHEVHNLYGSQMAEATAAALLTRFPHERYFLLTRSSYIGTHRFAAVWTGDNHSWWEHLTLSIRTVASLNMCGFFFSGSDIGGHSGNCSAELLIRWTQLGAFLPLMRNHSAKGTRQQEPYAYDSATTLSLRNIIALRYALLTFLYSEFLHSVDALTPFIRTLSMEYSDAASLGVDDQFFVGRNLMVAPIVQPNSKGRAIQVPPGHWLLWRASRWDIRACFVMTEGTHFVEATLDEVPLLLRENSLLVVHAPALRTRNLNASEWIILGLVTTSASLTITIDDGITIRDQNSPRTTVTVTVVRQADGLKSSLDIRSNPIVPLPITHISYEILDVRGQVHCWRESVI